MSDMAVATTISASCPEVLKMLVTRPDPKLARREFVSDVVPGVSNAPEDLTSPFSRMESVAPA